jgi:hypothetical protein
MKKLLALVLCVMMFVSVVPTSAFAGGLAVDVATNTVSTYNTQIKNMIKNTRTDVENSYKALVGDKVVYTSAKAMDDAIVGLVDAITDPMIEKGSKLPNGDRVTKTFADAVKAAVRSYFDATVAEKINDNLYKARDKDGKIDDLKYAQLVTDSMAKALNDKDFVKGYQAVATYFALANIVNDIRDDLKDEYQAFYDSVDADWDSKFAGRYPTLAYTYIDSYATAADKALANSVLKAALEEALYNAEVTLDAAIAGPAATYETDLENAETTYDKAVKTAEGKLEKAADAVKTAEKELELEKKNPAATKDSIEKKELALKQKEAEYVTAEKTYTAEIKTADKKYADDVKTAEYNYDLNTYQAYFAYDEAVETAEDTYHDNFQYTNPWAEYVRPSTSINWWDN